MESGAETRPTLDRPTSIAFQILLSLSDAERHGYGIMKEVADRTGGTVTLRPGTLYRAVRKMLQDGWVEESDDRPDPDNDDERRRYYRLTELGREVAEGEARQLEAAVHAAYRKSLIDPRPRATGEVS